MRALALAFAFGPGLLPGESCLAVGALVIPPSVVVDTRGGPSAGSPLPDALPIA